MEQTPHVFGPVPSRRLGRSLGIDPLLPKTCNFNCVYCQLGCTKTYSVERREFVPAEDIVAEFETVCAERTPLEADWITLVASGETCLHSRLGWIIREVRERTELPLAIITNGSLLYRPNVRAEIGLADAVLTSLDAGSGEVYRRINRPHPEFSFDKQVRGLAEFRQSYSGKLWLEVMLVDGVNDSEESLRDLVQIVEAIGPDEIDLSFPTRPPAESWVRPPGREAFMKAMSLLGDAAKVIPPVDGLFELAPGEDVVKAVLMILLRHPMRQEELERSLERWVPGGVHEALSTLEADPRLKVVSRLGTKFWSASRGDFTEA